MKTIEKAIDAIFVIIKWVIAVLFSVLVVLVFLQVFNRFVLRKSLTWSTELANYAMMWIALLGSAILMRSKGHMAINNVLDALHGAPKKAVMAVSVVLQALFLVGWIYGCAVFLPTVTGQFSPVLRLNMAAVNSVFLITGVLMLLAMVDYPAEKKPNAREIWGAFRQAFLTLLLPIIIMGSILTGVCTATEAAVLAVVYALILSLFVYRTLPLKDIPDVLMNAAKSSAMVLIVVAAANMLSWAVTMMNIPQMVSAFVHSLTSSSAVFLIIVNLILIVAGMFLDASSAIMILTPVLLPIALELNVDPLLFGIIMTVNLSIGVLTPPVGLNLYVVSSLSNIDILRVAKAAVPFILLIFAILVVASVWPPLITALPNLLYG